MGSKLVRVITFIVVLVLIQNLFLIACKKGTSEVTSFKNQTISSTQKKITSLKATKSATAKSTTILDASGNVIDDDNGEIESPIFDHTEGDTEGQVEEEKIDLGGRTITIKSRWLLQSDGGGCEGVWGEEEKKLVMESVYNAEQKYNFKLKVIPYASLGNLDFAPVSWLAAYTAGIQPPEHAMQNAFDITWFPYITNGVIMPLDDIIDFNNDPLWSQSNISGGAKFNNKHWGLLNIKSGKHIGEVGSCIITNKTLLEREGIPDLYETYCINKTWNYDNFLSVALKIARDINGDGVVDQLGVTFDRQNGISYILASNGARTIEYIDGKYIYGLETKEAIRALQFFTDLQFYYKVGSSENTIGAAYLKFYNGAVGMWLTDAYIIRNIILSSSKDFANENYNLIPLPMGPDVSDYQTMYLSPVITYFPSNLNDAEDIVKAIAYMLGEGIKNYSKDIWSDAQYYTGKNLEIYENLGGKMKWFPITQIGYLKGSALTSYNSFANGQKFVTQFIDETRLIQQQIIDDYLNIPLGLK